MLFEMSLNVALGILTFFMVAILMLSAAILHSVMIEERRIKQEVKKADIRFKKEQAAKRRS